jgi:transketolase
MNKFKQIKNPTKSNNEPLVTAFGETLCKLVKSGENVVALDADVGTSTKTCALLEIEKERLMPARLSPSKTPDLFIQGDIAEQNLIGVAAGLASLGLFNIFVSTFAVFATGEVYNQIRQSAAYENISHVLNLKIVGTHAGIATGPDGPTHHGTEDIGLMSLLPKKIIDVENVWDPKKRKVFKKFFKKENMRIMAPADATQTRSIIDWSARNDGPMYIRLPRGAHPKIFSEYDYSTNEPDVLVDSEKDDVTLFCHGTMVFPSIKAAEKLKKEGINAKVVNVHTILPFNKSIVKKYIKETNAFVVAEDHVEEAGLLSKILLHKVTPNWNKVIVPGFTSSGSQKDLYKLYGLTVDDICRKAKKAIAKKD